MKPCGTNYPGGALDSLIEAVEHIRRCFRCARIFVIANNMVAASECRYEELRPWGLVNLLLPELRRCSGWPGAV
jgi:hypothetical protein